MALPEGEINKRFKHAVWALPILISLPFQPFRTYFKV